MIDLALVGRYERQAFEAWSQTSAVRRAGGMNVCVTRRVNPPEQWESMPKKEEGGKRRENGQVDDGERPGGGVEALQQGTVSRA